MGILGNLKSLFSTKALVEQTVETQVRIYNKQEELFPGQDPHEYLAQVWLSRMVAHGQDPHNLKLQEVAYRETFLCACVPPPYCARALGHFILWKENPLLSIA